jgi:serine/threonine protein kinase
MFSSTVSPPNQNPSTLWCDAIKGFGDSKCIGGFSSFATASTLSTRSDDVELLHQNNHNQRDPELNEIFASSPDDDHGMGRSELSTSEVQNRTRDDGAGASGVEGSFFFPSWASSSSLQPNSRAKPPLPGANGVSHLSSSSSSSFSSSSLSSSASSSSSLSASTPVLNSTSSSTSGGRGGVGGGRPLPDQNAFDPPSVQSGFRGGSRTWYQSPSSSSNNGSSNSCAIGKAKNSSAAAPACPPTPVRTPAWAAHAAAAAAEEAEASAAAQSFSNSRFVQFPGGCQEFTGTLDFDDAVDINDETEEKVKEGDESKISFSSRNHRTSSSSSMLLSGTSPARGGTVGTPRKGRGDVGVEGAADNHHHHHNNHHHLWRQTSINETKTLMYSSNPSSATKGAGVGSSLGSSLSSIDGGHTSSNGMMPFTNNGILPSSSLSSTTASLFPQKNTENVDDGGDRSGGSRGILFPASEEEVKNSTAWNAASQSDRFAANPPPSSSSSSSPSTSMSSISFERDFAVLRHLGHGSFSRVMEALHRPSNQRFAVKRALNIMKNKSDRDRLLREFRLATRAGPHPNIIHYSVAWQEAGYLYFATELCAGGNLRQLQERLPEGTAMPERTIWTFIAHVASGLAHLHSKGIVHLDIKPENVFIASANDGAVLKIGDFGLAADFSSSSPQQLAATQQQRQLKTSDISTIQDSLAFGITNSNDASAAAGSSSSDCSFAMNVSVSSSDCGDVDDNDNEGDSRFMALELLSQGGRAPAADVFSLGMSAFEMAWDIAAPAEGAPWRDVREGRLPPLPPHCNPSNRSLDLLTLVSAMLRPDTRTRPTAADILALPQVQYVIANGPDPLLSFHSREIEEARNGGTSSSTAAAAAAIKSFGAHQHKPEHVSVLPSLLAVPKNNTAVPAMVSALAAAVAVGDNTKPMMGRSRSYREENDDEKYPRFVESVIVGENQLGNTKPALPAKATRTQASPSASSSSSSSSSIQHQPSELIRGKTLFVNDDDDYDNDEKKDEADVKSQRQLFNDDHGRTGGGAVDTSVIKSDEENGAENVFLHGSQPSDADIEDGPVSSSSAMTESDLPNSRLRLRRAIDFVNESTDIFVASSSSSSSSPTKTAISSLSAENATMVVSNGTTSEQSFSTQAISSTLPSTTSSFFPSVPLPLSNLSQQVQANKQSQVPTLSAQPSALFKPYSVSARKHPRDYDKHQTTSTSSSSSSLFAPAPFGGAFSFASPKATNAAYPMAAPSSIGALDMRSLQAQMPSATPGRGTRARTQRRRGVVLQTQGPTLGSSLERIDSPIPHLPQQQNHLVNDSMADGSESGFMSSQPLSAISSTSSSQSSSQQTTSAAGSHMMSSVSSSEEGSGGGMRAYNPQHASNIIVNYDSTQRYRTTSPELVSSSVAGSYPRNGVTSASTGAQSNSEFRLDESAVSYNQHDESIMSTSAVDTAFFSTRKVPQHFFQAPQTTQNSLTINVNNNGGNTAWHSSGAPSPSEGGGVTPIAKRERVGSSPITTSHIQASHTVPSSANMSNTISRSSDAHAGILGTGDNSMQQQHQHLQQLQQHQLLKSGGNLIQQQQQQQHHHLMRPTPVLATSSQHYLHRPLPTPLPSSSSSIHGHDGSASHHMQLATHKVWGNKGANDRDDLAAPMSIVAPSAYHHHFGSSTSDHRMETSTDGHDKSLLLSRSDAPAAPIQLKWDTDDDFDEPEGLLRRAQTSPIQMATNNSSPTATSPKQITSQQSGGSSFASRLQQTRHNSVAAPVKSRLSSSSSPRLSFAGGGGAPTPVRDFLPPPSTYRGGGGGGGGNPSDGAPGRVSAQQRESRGSEQASSPTSPKAIDVASSSYAAHVNARRMFNSFPGSGHSTDTVIPTLLPIPTRQQSFPLRIQVNTSRPGTASAAFDGQTTPLNDGFVTPFGQGIVLDAKHWMANM